MLDHPERRPLDATVTNLGDRQAMEGESTAARSISIRQIASYLCCRAARTWRAGNDGRSDMGGQRRFRPTTPACIRLPVLRPRPIFFARTDRVLA